MRKVAGLLIAFAVFVINPAYGCFGGKREFTYGAAEMTAAIAGTWTVTLDREAPSPITFRLEQKKVDVESRAPGFIGEAAACSQRTLIASANACVDSTTMPLVVIALDGSTRKLGGEFAVHSTVFTKGQLKLEIDGRTVDAVIDRDGTVAQVFDGATLVHTR